MATAIVMVEDVVCHELIYYVLMLVNLLTCIAKVRLITQFRYDVIRWGDFDADGIYRQVKG